MMEINNKRKTIIFDFYGVICAEVAPFWFLKYIDKEKASQLKEKYVNPADLGETSDKQLFVQLGVLVNKPWGEVRKEWLNLVKINTEVVSLIRIIKPNYRIVLGSNAISSLIHQIIKENDLGDLFDNLFVSSEIHVSKPNKLFFKKILETLEEDPKNLIFIDDNPNNIAVASIMGIKSYLFTSVKDLKFLIK